MQDMNLMARQWKSGAPSLVAMKICAVDRFLASFPACALSLVGLALDLDLWLTTMKVFGWSVTTAWFSHEFLGRLVHTRDRDPSSAFLSLSFLASFSAVMRMLS
jgi:hypothetical protein